MSLVARLLFPPHCETAVRGPHLALPQLSAYAASQGYEVATRDLNIEFFRHVTSPAIAERELAPLAERFADICARESLSEAEFDLAVELAQVGPLRERLAAGETSESDFWLTLRLLASRLYTLPRNFAHILAEANAPGSTLVDAYFDTLDLDALCGDVPMIGISVAFHLQLYPALSLARRIRQRYPDVLVVFGGSQTSLMTEAQQAALVELPFVDALVLYEGELALVELCRQVSGDAPRELATVPNTMYADAGGVQRSCWKLPPAMSELPTPRFDEASLREYLPPRVLPVYVSKGCYWGKCKFCDYTKLYTPGQAKTQAWATFRPPEEIVEDMRALQRQFGTSNFYLVSEAIPPSYYRKLAERILEVGLRVDLSSYCRVEKTHDFGFFALLRRAGVSTLTLGVEATEDRILELIDKGNTVRDIRQTIRFARAAGIAVTFNLIPDYPSITWTDVERMFAFIRDNVDFIGTLNPQFFDLSSNSVIVAEQQEHGIAVGDGTVHTNHGVHSITYERTRGLSPEQIARLRRMFERLDADLALYRRIAPLQAIVRHPCFDWDRATFVLANDVARAWLPFDPAGYADRRIPWAERRQLVLTVHATRRHLAMPDAIEAVVDFANDGRPFCIDELVELTRGEDPNVDADVLRELLRNCMNALVEAGMIARVYHPWLPLPGIPVAGPA